MQQDLDNANSENGYGVWTCTCKIFHLKDSELYNKWTSGN